MSQGSVPMLRSYTGGAWRTGGGEGVALHDAVTGDPVARISSAGIDMAAALDGLENLRFLTPVKPGDELTVTLTARQITPRENADYGEVRWDADVTNQRGESVATYDVLTLVAKEWTP